MFYSAMLKKYKFLFICLFLIFVGSLLRLYKLGIIPHGMTWDEAAIGYNGYAVISKRRDEWLVRLPVSFKSFGDYKAPFAIYLNGFFTYFLGMKLWVVRLPFYLSSVVSLAGSALLAYLLGEYFYKKNKIARNFSLIFLFLLIFSPWHFHYSRIGFESGMALTQIILAVSLFLLFLKIKNNKYLKFISVFSAGFFVSLSLYTYHSSKIFWPLFGVFLLINFYKKIKNKISLSVAGIINLIFLYPLFKDSLLGDGGSRFFQSSILFEYKNLELVKILFWQTVTHLSPQFLIFGQTDTLRHGTGNWGVLFSTTLLLIIIAIAMAVLKKLGKCKKNIFNLKLFYFSAAWILAGLLPAIIGKGVPHSNRALLALPGFLLLASQGLIILLDIANTSKLNQKLRGTHNEENILVKIIIGLFISTHIILFLGFWNYYFDDYAKTSTNSFNDGYLEAFNYVLPYEKGRDGKNQVKQIIFTDKYEHPYIYALFSRRTDPIWYQGGSLNKYLFKPVNSTDLQTKNVVIISTPQEIPDQIADYYINGVDGSVRFKIFLN